MENSPIYIGAIFVLLFLKGTFAIGTVIQIFGVAFSTKQIRLLFGIAKKHAICEFKISDPCVCAICFSDLGQDKLCLTVIERHDEKWEKFM